MVIQRGGPATYSREPFDRVAAELDAYTTNAFENLRRLEREVNRHLAPPHDDRAWLFHARYLQERLSSIHIILGRLIKLKHEEALRSWQEHMHLAQSISVEQRMLQMPTEALQAQNMRLQAMLSQMGLDFECLYIFGNMALDQWAMVVAYLTGEPDPGEIKYPFHNLTMRLQERGDTGAIRLLWERHRIDIIWLYYHIRRVRNHFIEHMDRAWYSGKSAAIFGIDFNLDMHPPRERINPEDVERAAGEFVRNLGRRHWPTIAESEWTFSFRETLRYVFHGIDAIEDKGAQERLWKVWKEIGGEGPSFHIVAVRLLRFLQLSIATLIEIVQAHPDRINGRRIGEQMKSSTVFN